MLDNIIHYSPQIFTISCAVLGITFVTYLGVKIKKKGIVYAS